MKVEGSIDVRYLFIGASQNSFHGGVFVLSIGDSTCVTYYPRSGDTTYFWCDCSVSKTNLFVCLNTKHLIIRYEIPMYTSLNRKDIARIRVMARQDIAEILLQDWKNTLWLGNQIMPCEAGGG